MMAITHFSISTTLVLCSLLLVTAQAQTPSIEVTTENDRAHFSTQGPARAMRVEVFSRSGELVFEQDAAPGQSIQWQMVDENGERVADGVYLVTITVTDTFGKRRKRIEQISVNRETQPKFELSTNTLIAPATAPSSKSYASMQPISLSGNRVRMIPVVNNPNITAPLSAEGATSVATEYNIGDPGALSILNVHNTFVGDDAGDRNTSGYDNSFFGSRAGRSNTTGHFNSFFGSFTAYRNMGGSGNSYFGYGTGVDNVYGSHNSFFGVSAGSENHGSDNSFFGARAGRSNGTASENAFFGSDAGARNQRGYGNSFFGSKAGQANITGSQNAFFGQRAGVANLGNSNSFFGQGSGSSNTTGSSNSFFGTSAGHANREGNDNTFFGRDAGGANRGGSGNTFIGLRAGDENISGSNNTYIGNDASGSAPLINATAIGANAYVRQNNSLVLGSINGINRATADTNIGIGTIEPLSNLHVKTGYVQLPFVNIAPAARDCTAATAGRMVVFANGLGPAQLFICDTSTPPNNQPNWVIK